MNLTTKGNQPKHSEDCGACVCALFLLHWTQPVQQCTLHRTRPSNYRQCIKGGNLTHVRLHTLLHRLQLGRANILSASKSTQRKHESIKLQSANVCERCLCAPFIGTAYLNPNCHSQLSPGLDHCKSQTRHRINKSTLTFGDRFVCDLIFPHFQIKFWHFQMEFWCFHIKFLYFENEFYWFYKILGLPKSMK